MDFPDQSNSAPANQQKKVKSAVVNGAVQVKRPATRRFADFILAESPKAVGRKITNDVVVPRFKQGLEEVLNSLLSGMLWGGNRPTGMISGNLMRGGNAYHSASTTGAGLLSARQASESKGVSYEDLVFMTQNEAELVLGNLFELINQYRVVAIGDLNDLVGNTSKPSDNAYGWNNLDGARISKNRDGFRLELPRPSLI